MYTHEQLIEGVAQALVHAGHDYWCHESQGVGECNCHPTLDLLLSLVVSTLERHAPWPGGEGMGWVNGKDYGEINPACSCCGTPDEYAQEWPCASVRQCAWILSRLGADIDVHV